MLHTKLIAPDGFKYKKKDGEYEFASIIFLGEGIAEEDYELITNEEYERLLQEQLELTMSIL